MAETTAYLHSEKALVGTRYVHRATMATGDVLNVIGFPADRDVKVKVYLATGSGTTASVYSTTDTEANITATGTTTTKQLWDLGAVTADAEDVLEAGHTGVVITATGGAGDIEVVA